MKICPLCYCAPRCLVKHLRVSHPSLWPPGAEQRPTPSKENTNPCHESPAAALHLLAALGWDDTAATARVCARVARRGHIVALVDFANICTVFRELHYADPFGDKLLAASVHMVSFIESRAPCEHLLTPLSLALRDRRVLQVHAVPHGKEAADFAMVDFASALLEGSPGRFRLRFVTNDVRHGESCKELYTCDSRVGVLSLPEFLDLSWIDKST